MSGQVERAKQVQAEGGLARPEGGMRSLGGVFFVLVKESVGIEAYRGVTLTRWQRLKERRARLAQPAQSASAASTHREHDGPVQAEHGTP